MGAGVFGSTSRWHVRRVRGPLPFSASEPQRPSQTPFGHSGRYFPWVLAENDL